MPSNLPSFKRIITAHNEKGEAVIDHTIDQEAPFDHTVVGGTAGFCLAYTTSDFPADLNNNVDIKKYQEDLVKPPGLSNGGSVLRIVDMGPGITSPMHRTVSIDYGVVMIGEVELVLDSGDKQLLKPGDICIQRATIHAWRNPSTTDWARMLYVLAPCQPLKINGKELGEDYGHGMSGVAASK